jgi:hypothetical protein
MGSGFRLRIPFSTPNSARKKMGIRKFNKKKTRDKRPGGPGRAFFARALEPLIDR